MLSQGLQEYARTAWETARHSLGTIGRSHQEQLEALCGDLRTLMELSLGTLPTSDVATVPFSTLLGFARHALAQRASSPYCRDIPEDIFLHCVFYPRVNSEDLVDCRGFFAEHLTPLVEGLTGPEAALAVNRWCAAQLTYESTDLRSENPLTAFFCGLGRCGEESTFAVTAFRSVGIPARQVYVPWWSHCDDNHAWVEVYVDGAWHFLGACEPEPILDRGWFSDASSRAMLVCSRNFFDYVGQGMAGEMLTQRQGSCCFFNQTARYAETAQLSFTVTDSAGRPQAGVQVSFYVFNMAAPAKIAQLPTNAAGLVFLKTGLGSLYIEAQSGNQFARAALTVSEDTCQTLALTEQEPRETVWDLDFFAPTPTGRNRTALTPAQEREKAAVLLQANEQRINRISSYWKSEYQTGDAELDQVFRRAGGNAAALWSFYKDCRPDERPTTRSLLLSLAEKDWRDVKPEVLQAHLAAAGSLPNPDSPLFLPFVLCPRIGYELLEAWRAPILQALTPERQAQFRENPPALWSWIQDNFQEGSCNWYPVLSLLPTGALALGAADEKGRRLLFVAILRTLGIPARLNPIDGTVQYAVNHVFCTPETQKAAPAEPAFLTLRMPESLVYGQSYTLSRWENGWLPLDYTGTQALTFQLAPGIYRLITVNRLPNGNQLVRLTTFYLGPGACREIAAELRPAAPEQMLSDILLGPLPFLDAAGQSAMQGGGPLLAVYLDVGTEPTEHILNELLEAREAMTLAIHAGLSLHVLLRGPEARRDPTLQRVLDALPEIRVHFADFHSPAADRLARCLYLEPGVWPLVVLTDGSARGYFGRCGYSVGTVSLLLRLLASIRPEFKT